MCCLLLLLYNSVVSSCRPWCRALLPIGISSYIYLLAPWCVSVAPRGMLCVVSSYILLYRLVVPARYSCRSSCRACSCGLVTSSLAVAPAGPRGYRQATDQQGGGDFSKRGERQTETRPVPIFMRKVEKNVVFQCKAVRIQCKTWEISVKTWET